MGLINSIGSWFEKITGGFKFGTQAESISVKGNVEVETNGIAATHYFPDRDGNIILEDDIIPTDVTGVLIDFVFPKTFGTHLTPGSGEITHTLISARKGIVQKIYHNDATEPTVPGTWTKLGNTNYATSELNIIYAEWCGGTRVEYWITQIN